MKKLFTILLAVAMLATLSVTAFAANTEGGSTEVSFNVDPTYTVTIPATVELNKVEDNGTVTYENDYTLTAQAGVRLKKGEYIEVTVATDNEMETPEGATLAYTITKDDAALENNVVATFTTDKAAQTSTIHIAAGDPDYAGDYSDTVTFTISVQQVAPAIINFTIGGDPYQAEEGMTWAQWVESAYNNGGFYSAYESVYWGEDLWFILCNSGKTPSDDDYYVNEEDVIQANTDYVLIEMTEA
jgi:hypothetical protein